MIPNNVIRKLQAPGVPYKTTITGDEYRRDWEPAGWHMIVIGPTSSWRQEWGDWEAIRDIVQNCLDESESYTYGRGVHGLWIHDSGSGLMVSDLLLGPSKVKPDYARGKYGEGMKVSCLAMLRKGHPVYVDTVGKEVVIIFSPQEVNGQVQILSALWKNTTRSHGTTFYLIGYHGQDFSGRFTVNIPKSRILFQAPSQVYRPHLRYNQIIQPDLRGGPQLYIRDIWMRSVPHWMYSYNLWDVELAPDRHAPRNEGNIDEDLGRVWSCVDRQQLITKFMRGTACDSRNETGCVDFSFMGSYPSLLPGPSNINYADVLQKNSGLWQAAWKSVYGYNAVVSTEASLRGPTEWLGYNPIVIPGNLKYGLSGRHDILPTDKEVCTKSAQELAKGKIIPFESLSPTQQKNLTFARAISNNYMIYGGSGRSATVECAMLGSALGLYDPVAQMIQINPTQLNSTQSTVDTVVHEIAHVVSGAEDLTAAHARALSSVAATLVRDITLDFYKKQLISVGWK